MSLGWWTRCRRPDSWPWARTRATGAPPSSTLTESGTSLAAWWAVLFAQAAGHLFAGVPGADLSGFVGILDQVLDRPRADPSAGTTTTTTTG
jgi:hypothetical protein